MAWRRRRDVEAPDEAVDSAAASAAAGDDGSAPEPLIPDDVVLDELSRAFGDEESVRVGTEVSAVDESGTSSGGAATAGGEASSRGTISIIGDDLPDVTYLDDELAGEASGPGLVFIDDDGSSDAVAAKDASTRGIEPRIRQRRIGVKRAENRRRLWWLVLLGAVLAVVIAVLAVLGSSLFAVDTVTVTGNVYTDRDALDTIVDDLTGTPVLLVDTDEFEARVEMIPWVEEARVRTSFPDSASIDIRERTPLAAMQGTDGFVRVIDVDGRVLGLVEGQPVALVWISGPGTLDVAPGQFASIGYSAAASLVTKLTPDIRSRVDSMLVTSDGADLVLILASDRGPIEVRFGSALGENAQIEKLVRLQRTLDDIDTKPVTVIDVSTSEVTVR